MTNEQTAIVLEKYESLLFEGLKKARMAIPSTEGENFLGSAIEIWPELELIDDLLGKLNSDIDLLRGKS